MWLWLCVCALWLCGCGFVCVCPVAVWLWLCVCALWLCGCGFVCVCPVAVWLWLCVCDLWLCGCIPGDVTALVPLSDLLNHRHGANVLHHRESAVNSPNLTDTTVPIVSYLQPVHAR